MLTLQIDDIDQAALKRLIDNQVAERRDLEFKRDLPGGSNDEKKEFLADVTSMANAQGGDIIYGIEEENGVASTLSGMDIDDIDAAILRLESMLSSGVSPRMLGMRIHAVPLEGGRWVVVIRVIASFIQPHRIVFQNSGRFFSRNSRGKFEMDVTELRHAFLQSEGVGSTFRVLHDQAVAYSDGEQMPFALPRLPKAILSIAPLAHFQQEHLIEVNADTAVPPQLSLHYGGFSWIETIDGMLLHTPIGEDGSVHSWAISHRTGRVDLAWVIGGPRAGARDEELLLVFPESFEEGLKSGAVAAHSFLQKFGFSGPWIISCSIRNCLSYKLVLNNHYLSHHSYRDSVFLGQRVIEEIDKADLCKMADIFWLLFSQRRPADRELGNQR